MKVLFWASWVVFVASCTKPNSAVCHENQCLDPEAPYCDVEGVVGGSPGKCVAIDCPAGQFETCAGDTALICNTTGTSYDRFKCPAGCDPNSGCEPFCTPGSIVDCVGDQLMACNATGTGTTAEVCGLGCSTTEKKCRSFQPSNGLGFVLDDAFTQPAATIPAGSTINSTNRTVIDPQGNVLPIKSYQISQNDGPLIAAFAAGSFVINDATVIGTSSVAFVAAGSIEIRGRIAARAIGRASGAGASTSLSCRGGDVSQYACMCANACSVGAGGAGNHVAGGQGGAAVVNGGSAITVFSPLAGGCVGGSQFGTDSTTLRARGGGGGGAIQLVAGGAVTLKDQGLIDVGGGGGESTAGGGSGGLVIIEAPTVTVMGPLAGIAANGAAGGGCGMTGPDASANGTPAAGAICPNYFAGSGGTGTTNPGRGCVIGVDNCVGACEIIYGGGGGAVGRARIVSKDGNYVTSGSPILSVQLTAGTLNPK
ncbi:MAG: hypothetical protein M4D80_33375 [Myxococcota bacterium]|nr:hypothetical protein [Myxococcota bacterium]